MKLRIEKAIYGGAGLARAEGKVLFVPFALPGEIVRTHATEQKHGYSTAQLEAVMEPSAARVTAPCPYFGPCGGCHYQHAKYAAQLEIKRAILRETLERAGVKDVPEITTVPSEPFGYRNRIRLHVRRNPFSVGYNKRNSHDVLPVEACPIAAPALQRAIAALNREGLRLGLAEWANEIELFVNEEESAMLAALWTERARSGAKPALERLWSQGREYLPELAGVGIFPVERGRRAERLLAYAGEQALQYQCGNHSFYVSLGSFFQVNRFLIEALSRLVTEGEYGDSVWDLYAGVGLFSRALASSFTKVTAVETSPSAVRDLHENLRGTLHRVMATTTAAWLTQAAARREKSPDLLVVDPPREGLRPAVTSLLAKIHPQRITYVSCDPATLARDVAALHPSGFRLARLRLIDLFPQTFHIESVAHLTTG